MASDYFTALMRASGLRPAAVPPAVDRVPAAESLVEEHTQQTAEPVADSLPTQTLPAVRSFDSSPIDSGPEMAESPPAIPPYAEPPRSSQAAAPAESSAKDARAAAGVLTVPSAQSAPQVAVPDAAPPSDLPDAGPASKTDGQAVVQQDALLRVALNWVRSGASSDTPPRALPTQHEGSAETAEPGLQTGPEADTAPPVIAVAKAAPTPAGPVRADTLPAMRDLSPAAAAPWSDVWSSRETAPRDTVEISIDAIHLRVDAPPAKLAPQPVQPTATRAASAPRGDFQRRLLRRL